MKALTINSICRNCTFQASKKRLSDLQENDLVKIWNSCAEFAKERLLEKKTVVFADVGLLSLECKVRVLGMNSRKIWKPVFIPSKALRTHLMLDSSTNCDLKKVVPRGFIFLNYHVIAEKSGFDRYQLQSAISEITQEIFRQLKEGKCINLDFNGIGRACFSRHRFAFKFCEEFLLSFNPANREELGSPDLVLVINEEIEPVRVSGGDTPLSNTLDGAEKLVSYEDNNNAAPSELEHNNQEVELDNEEKAEEIDAAETQCLKLAIQEVEESLEESVKLPVVYPGKHRHSFSGDRLWSDTNCCICRQELSGKSSKDAEKIEAVEGKLFNDIYKHKRNSSPFNEYSRIISSPVLPDRELTVLPTFRRSQIRSPLKKDTSDTSINMEDIKAELLDIDRSLYSKRLRNFPQLNENGLAKKVDQFDFVQHAKNQSVFLKDLYRASMQKAKVDEAQRRQIEIKKSLEAVIKIQNELQKDYHLENTKRFKVRKSLESFWAHQAKIKQIKDKLYL